MFLRGALNPNFKHGMCCKKTKRERTGAPRGGNQQAARLIASLETSVRHHLSELSKHGCSVESPRELPERIEQSVCTEVPATCLPRLPVHLDGQCVTPPSHVEMFWVPVGPLPYTRICLPAYSRTGTRLLSPSPSPRDRVSPQGAVLATGLGGRSDRVHYSITQVREFVRRRKPRDYLRLILYQRHPTSVPASLFLALQPRSKAARTSVVFFGGDCCVDIAQSGSPGANVRGSHSAAPRRYRLRAAGQRGKISAKMCFPDD